MNTPDCGDNSCIYAKHQSGLRTNSGCQCDVCPECGKRVMPAGLGYPPYMRMHRRWCPDQDWIAGHHNYPTGSVSR